MGNDMKPEKPRLTLLEEFEKVSHIYFATGHYMYIETSSPRVRGDYAILISPMMKFSGTNCLKFSYHMYGTTIGRLDVSINSRNVFSTSGDHGNNWYDANIPTSVSGVYRVRKISLLLQTLLALYCHFVCFWQFANL